MDNIVVPCFFDSRCIYNKIAIVCFRFHPDLLLYYCAIERLESCDKFVAVSLAISIPAITTVNLISEQMESTLSAVRHAINPMWFKETAHSILS